MTKPDDIRSMLSQGRGRIEVGRAEEVADLIRKQAKMANRLIECLWDKDPGVSNRAAHALEKITRDGLAALDPVVAVILDSSKPSLLGLLAEATELTEAKLRWHLALIVPRLRLTVPECHRAAQALESWLEDRSSIVGTMAMQGLYDLIRLDPSLLPHVLDLLRIHSRTGTPAMRARGRRLLQILEPAGEE